MEQYGAVSCRSRLIIFLCFSLFSLLLLLLFAGLATLPALFANSAAMRRHPTAHQAAATTSLAYRWTASVTYHTTTTDYRSSTSLTTNFYSPERERMATYLNPMSTDSQWRWTQKMMVMDYWNRTILRRKPSVYLY